LLKSIHKVTSTTGLNLEELIFEKLLIRSQKLVLDRLTHLDACASIETKAHLDINRDRHGSVFIRLEGPAALQEVSAIFTDVCKFRLV
jgi:hypothetical protein